LDVKFLQRRSFIVKRKLMTAVVLLCTTAGVAGGYHLLTTHPEVGAEEKPTTAVRRDRVTLTDAKLAAAKIKVAGVEQRTLNPVRTVPGRIEYNGTRHVSVKSPADGLVQKMAVTVGDRVEAGQLLAVVNSPELGERRADVLKQQADLELARRDRDWWRSIQTNLIDLMAKLKRPQEIASLEEEFQDRILGDYRRDIFSAYSKFRTAEAINANLKPLSGGVISQRMVLEQASARDSASATFQAACEQAIFDARQKVGRADSLFDDASRRLAVARQRLTWLTGQSADQIGDLSKEEMLSTWPVVAPFSATVEELYIAATERVRLGEDIVLLADTSKLWVQADIRDKDWSALKLSPGQKIQVQTPALPDTTLESTIAFIGRTVNQETRATPVVADIPNEDRLLKPGMFVRVLLPDGAAVEAIAVPESAVVRSEGRTYVFVATSAHEFTPRDVTLGMTVDPWVEVKAGLAVGDQIAISGTFLLKSEMLLEPEE
jgi:cobalt-zinc-cadmium efflux system membrane fusion protein